jgi:hypothetical protein
MIYITYLSRHTGRSPFSSSRSAPKIRSISSLLSQPVEAAMIAMGEKSTKRRLSLNGMFSGKQTKPIPMANIVLSISCNTQYTISVHHRYIPLNQWSHLPTTIIRYGVHFLHSENDVDRISLVTVPLQRRTLGSGTWSGGYRQTRRISDDDEAILTNDPL